MGNKRILIFLAFLLFLSSSSFAQDRILLLNTGWKFRNAGTNDEWLPAKTPGTVHTDLFANGKISDPFLECNNINLGWIDEADWEYLLKFDIEKGIIEGKYVELVFNGLDTYADVYLNETLVFKADNMFRNWVFDCSKLFRLGRNSIRIVFKSTLAEVRKKSKELPYSLPGGEWAWVRKAPYHFGWDWGPRFVTAGIWKPVYIKTWQRITLKNDIQVHTISVNKDSALLSANLLLVSEKNTKASILVLSGNKKIASIKVDIKKGENRVIVPFAIHNPKLWWCNGSGEQNLYDFDFNITCENLIISKLIKYGIRTLELVQYPDSIGKSFFFKLNGVPVFMKGANIIPRHSFLPSASTDVLKSLLKSASDCGINMLRVWGGGVYEDDLFYNLCDSLGILIWQDFMFAGRMYPGDSAFLSNVKAEVTQQVSRLRNHPSIALWCGNNEVDEAWSNWGWQKLYNLSRTDSSKIWHDYVNLFQKLIPEVISIHDSERPYWSSSPKNGWGRESSMTEGDSHYWGVWWGLEPFSVYKTKIPRFMSEYGFQSFPALNTIYSFSKNGSEEPDSLGLLCHQKHPVGYQTIDRYSQFEGFNPKTLPEKIYISQIVQSIGYRIAIESHRLAKPRCMGTLYWQLNDCWPVVSWSSIDFYGRWKAVQYTIRETYKPILLSAQIHNNEIVVNAVSDLLDTKEGMLKVQVYRFNGDILRNWEKTIAVNPNISEQIFNTGYQFINADSANLFVYSEFTSKSGETYNSYFYSCKQGNLKVQNPEIMYKVEKVEKESYLVLTCNKPALYVQLSSISANCNVDNNFFNMIPGKDYRVKVLEGDVDRIEIKSLFDYLH